MIFVQFACAVPGNYLGKQGKKEKKENKENKENKGNKNKGNKNKGKELEFIILIRGRYRWIRRKM